MLLLSLAAAVSNCDKSDDNNPSPSDDDDDDDDDDNDGDDDNSVDNVAACERWVDTVSCGDFDFSMLVDCDLYEDTVCDISDYFDCLSDNTECNDGVPDTQGWQNCVEEAECDERVGDDAMIAPARDDSSRRR